jgi:hypothetical protein
MRQGKRFEAKQKCKTHQGGKTQAQKRERREEGVGERDGRKMHSAHGKQQQEHTNTQTHQNTQLKEQLAKTLPASLASMNSQM